MQNYASLQETQDQEEQGILFHVSEPTRSRWNHIEDLDSFFTRVYKYHQRHGFACMLLQEIFGLHQYTFVVCLTLYLSYGIDYNTLFQNGSSNKTRVTIPEVMLPVGECIHNFNTFTWFLIVVAVILVGLKFIVKVYQMILFWDIKQFYNQALEVSDKELDNLTWYDIQAKLKMVQLEQQMCIHKRELTELDIYHRILRQENYLVAMVNKRLLPPRFHIPFLGEIVYWTKGLRYNIMGLFFWSPWSPFENPWHLREDYKRQSLRRELAAQLGKHVLWLAVLNIVFSPLILIWQVLFYFFNYFELVRREPGKFGVRYWSLYAHLYFRHFNELDHELHARLTRAYRPATKYLSSFSSPIVTVTSQHIAFLCSAVLAVFLTLSFYDNEVIYVEQVISVIAFLTGVIAVCRSLKPDETTVWCPEGLLQAVVMHTHYLPGNWKGQSHTLKVRSDFQQLFQYRFAALLEEFLSPILTPYCLIRYVYPRALDIVDFFRNFTVSVVGVGDVCSFAQMDIRKHGNPAWHSELDSTIEESPANQYSQAEDGKVELSLVHFATTNPEWVPPEEAQQFVNNVDEETNMRYNDLLYDMSVCNLLNTSSLRDFEPAIHSRSSIVNPYDVEDVRTALVSRSEVRKRSGAKSTVFDDFRNSLSAIAANQGSVWMADGREPDIGTRNMRASTMTLHNRHSKKVVLNLEETTPLLGGQK